MIIFDRGDPTQTGGHVVGSQTVSFPLAFPHSSAEPRRVRPQFSTHQHTSTHLRAPRKVEKHHIFCPPRNPPAIRIETRVGLHVRSSGADLPPGTWHVEHPFHSLTERGGLRRLCIHSARGSILFRRT